MGGAKLARNRKAQFEHAAMRIVALFGDETTLMDRIIGLRQALAQTGTAAPGSNAAFANRISDFDGKIDAVRKKIVATTEGGAITGEEHLCAPTSFTEQFSVTKARFIRSLTSTRLNAELDDVTKQFHQLLAQDLPALNDSLQSKGQSCRPGESQSHGSAGGKVARQPQSARCQRTCAFGISPGRFRTRVRLFGNIRDRCAEDWKLIFRATNGARCRGCFSSASVLIITPG